MIGFKLFFLFSLVVLSFEIWALPGQGRFLSNCSTTACSFATQTQEGFRLAKDLNSIANKMSGERLGICNYQEVPDQFCDCIKKSNYEIPEDFSSVARAQIKNAFPDLYQLSIVGNRYPVDGKSIDIYYCQLVDGEQYKATKLYNQIQTFYKHRSLLKVSDEKLLTLTLAVKEVISSAVIGDDKKKDLIPFLQKIMEINGRAVGAKVECSSIFLSDDPQILKLLPGPPKDASPEALTEDYIKSIAFINDYLATDKIKDKNQRYVVRLSEIALLNLGQDQGAENCKKSAIGILQRGMESENLKQQAVVAEVLFRLGKANVQVASDLLKVHETSLASKITDKENLIKDPVAYTYMSKVLLASEDKKIKQNAILGLYDALSSTNSEASVESAKTFLVKNADEIVYQSLGRQKATAIMENVLSDGTAEQKIDAAKTILSVNAVAEDAVTKDVQTKAILVLKKEMASNDGYVKLMAAEAIRSSAAPLSAVKEADTTIKNEQRFSFFSIKNTLAQTAGLSASGSEVRSAMKSLPTTGGWGVLDSLESSDKTDRYSFTSVNSNIAPAQTLPEEISPPVKEAKKDLNNGSTKGAIKSAISIGPSSNSNLASTTLAMPSYKNSYSTVSPDVLDSHTQNTFIEKTRKIPSEPEPETEENKGSMLEKKDKNKKVADTLTEKKATVENVRKNNDNYQSFENGNLANTLPESKKEQNAVSPSTSAKDQFNTSSSPRSKERADVAAKGDGVNGGEGENEISSSGSGSGSGVTSAGNDGKNESRDKNSSSEGLEKTLVDAEPFFYKRIIPYSMIESERSRIEVIKALELEGKQFESFDSEKNVIRIFDRITQESKDWDSNQKNNFLKEIKLIRENRQQQDNEKLLTHIASQTKEFSKRYITKEEENLINLKRISLEEIMRAVDMLRKHEPEMAKHKAQNPN